MSLGQHSGQEGQCMNAFFKKQKVSFGSRLLITDGTHLDKNLVLNRFKFLREFKNPRKLLLFLRLCHGTWVALDIVL